MDYRPISADSHMDMGYIPADTFTSRAPAEWRDRMPRVVEGGPNGPVWVAGKDGEYKMGAWGIHGQPGLQLRIRAGETPASLRLKAMVEAGFMPDERRPSDPVRRLEDQEKDGVDAEVMYGIFTLSGSLKDRDAAAVAFHAYNDYIAEFCRAQPDRFIGLGCIPGNNVEAAVAEVEHIAKLGLRGAEWSYLDNNTPIWHPQWEPLWAAVEDAGLVLSLHVRTDTTTTLRGIPGTENNPRVSAAWLSVGPMQLDEAVVSVIFCGALERHPKLKVVIAESGVGWIPYLLDRMDYEWQDHPAQSEIVSMLPSDLFRRQMFATFQKDAAGPMLAAQFCPDNFMWGSDYPHPDGVWPDSLEMIEQYVAPAGPEITRKIVRDNVAKLYNLGNGS